MGGMAGTTTVQRKTLVGALVLAAAFGAGGIALVSNVDDGGSTRISDVETTTTAEETTTSETPTTEPVVETTAAPTTAAPVTAAPAAPAPLEQKVAEHEDRITDLEATTTTQAPTPPPTVAPPTTEQNGNQ